MISVKDRLKQRISSVSLDKTVSFKLADKENPNELSTKLPSSFFAKEERPSSLKFSLISAITSELMPIPSEPGISARLAPANLTTPEVLSIKKLLCVS